MGALWGRCRPDRRSKISSQPRDQRRNSPAGKPAGLLLCLNQKICCPRALFPSLMGRAFAPKQAVRFSYQDKGGGRWAPTSLSLLPAVRAVARGCGFAPFRGGRWSVSSAAAVLDGRRPKNIRWPKGFSRVVSAVDSKFCSKGFSLCRRCCSGLSCQHSSHSNAGFAPQ